MTAAKCLDGIWEFVQIKETLTVLDAAVDFVALENLTGFFDFLLC